MIISSNYKTGINSAIAKDIVLTGVAYAEAQAKAAMYGIGIGTAILKETPTSNNYQVPNGDGQDNGSFWQPDSANAGGGQGSWDGTMSSVLQGMPVLSYLKFVGNTYTSLQGNQITIPDITFETVLISLKMGRTIKKTDIQGRDTGSVKEYISRKDWNVEIRAIISAGQPVNSNVEKMNSDGVYPRWNMSEIWKLLQAPVAIQVKCWYLNQFDINYLVIEDGVDIQQVEGEYSAQRIVIPCVSDNPLIIKVAK